MDDDLMDDLMEVVLRRYAQCRTLGDRVMLAGELTGLLGAVLKGIPEDQLTLFGVLQGLQMARDEAPEIFVDSGEMN